MSSVMSNSVQQYDFKSVVILNGNLSQEDASDESRSYEEEEGEEAEYDPLAADDEAVESGNMEEDVEHQSDSEDSIVEVVMERCDMCGDSLETREALVMHLAREHFQAGLCHELLSRGWVEGSVQCPGPSCEAEVSEDMVSHWAGHHGRAMAMVTRCLAGGEVRLREEKSYCHQFVQKWFRVDVRMENTHEANDKIKALLYGNEDKIEEVIDVEAEEEDCVIVLDDSSDDDIEIIDHCGAVFKSGQRKRTFDYKVEPILEHVAPSPHHKIDRASLTSIDQIRDQAPQSIKINKMGELDRREAHTEIVPHESPRIPHSDALESTKFEIADTADKQSVDKSHVAKAESDCLQEISSDDISNILGLPDESEAQSDNVNSDLEAVLQDVKPVNTVKNAQKQNIVSNLFNQLNCGSIQNNLSGSSPNLNSQVINPQSSPSRHVESSQSTNIVQSDANKPPPNIESNGLVEVLNISGDSDQSLEEPVDGNILNVVTNPETRAREEDMLRHVRPGLTQCLECLEELGSLANLKQHMLDTKHINISWAAQTNSGPGKGEIRWFKKPAKYICNMCHTSTNASFNYNSIKTVMLHIVEEHPETFHYNLSDIKSNHQFILCKICRSFISLERSTTEKSRRRKELAHYLNNHGEVFLYSLGILSVDSWDSLSCNLCLHTSQTYDNFCQHLLSEHAQDIIQRFRYFDLSQLECVASPDVCCICRAKDNSPEHLASHNKEILIKIGLIEINGLNKIVCKCCQSVSIQISRILNHFSTEHQNLYRFLTRKYLEFTSVTKNELTRMMCAPRHYEPSPVPLNHHSKQHEVLPMSQNGFQNQNTKADYSALTSFEKKSAIIPNSNGVTNPQHPGSIKSEQAALSEPEPSAPLPLRSEQPPNPIAPKIPGSGFENAFLNFVGSTASASSQFEDEKFSPIQTNFSTENLPYKTPEQVVRPVNRRKYERNTKSVESYDVCCRICDKPFDRVDKKGLVKSNSRVKVEINAHYLLHFRDQLMSKYPSSFTGPTPYRCEKCGHFSKTENLNAMKNLMLTHIASCQRELEALINEIPRTDPPPVTASPNPVLVNKEPNQGSELVTVGRAPELSWRQSATCLVCDSNITDTIRNYHYAGHFRQQMIDKFVTDKLSFKCSLCPLEMVENNDFALLKFLIHLGDVHDIFSEMVKTSALSPTKPPSVVPISNGFHNKENNFIPPQPHSQPVKRMVNPMQNFSSFLKHQEQHPKCLKCNQEADSLVILMRHLLRKHYINDINNDIIDFFPNFYEQEVVQGQVKCKRCSIMFPAKRSIVTDHIGVNHMDVLKHYFNDVKNDFISTKIKQGVCEEEELDTEMVLTSLLEDLDNENGEEVEKRENENFAKIQDYLGKAKASRRIFVQMGPCYLIDPHLSPCHECKKIISQNSQNINIGSCCCFEGFRKLKYNSSDVLVVAGYMDPGKDPKQSDIDNWSLESVGACEDLSVDLALFILTKVGSLLCDMVSVERRLALGVTRPVSWRRQHPGVREMCDVCSTTIFNIHLTCPTCGIMVCHDCYTARMDGTRYKTTGNLSRPYRTRRLRSAVDLDVNLWPLCLERRPHQVERLMMTQMSPGNVQETVVTKFHEVMNHFNIPTSCNCGTQSKNSATKRKFSEVNCNPKKFKSMQSNTRKKSLLNTVTSNSLAYIIGSFKSPDVDYSDTSSDEDEEDTFSSTVSMFKDEDNITKGLCQELGPDEDAGMDSLSPRHILTKQESSLISGEARHSWLCDGSLLQLEDAVSPHNMRLFQTQWARGQPVIICNSNQYMNRNLWHPRAFLKDFGHLKANLVNTKTGKTVPNQPMKWFWEGFEKVSHRPTDENGTPMLLKLKDWPSEDDIASYIPKRFHDLVHDFPIQSYTLREGSLNLASYIPKNFLKPELGPKMYIAYGNALYSNKASTNLHLDMSDAVNLLVHVGIPEDTDPEENIKLALQQIDEAGCDLSMRRRVRDEGKVPGALWHIYHPADTTRIRDFLTRVAIENHKRLDPHDDPIHDQSTYLTAGLRARLYKEYGVSGYAIIQCAGDTVFIPAGACHQVRNLHNCIKIAEDFVSPELSKNCLNLTQEFRNLTEHHTNHEDKLQIKNIIYHSIKNAVAKLARLLNKNEK